MKFETRTVHAGAGPDPATGGVSPALQLSTTFARDESGTPLGGHTYIRESNPNQAELETALARVEGGAGALAFGSGMAAGVAILQTLPPRSHVIFPDDAYYGYRIAGEEFFSGWGVDSTFVDMADLDALRAAVRPETRVLWMESPSNPLLKVVDLAAGARIAHEAGAFALVDGTFATAALQRPLELGADVVLHSTTKYIGGHSDVQGGALVFREAGELLERVRHVRHVLGAVLSPFNCWLTLRGLRTLAVRMAVHSANGLAVARALEAMPAVSVVHYPGLASHPGHDVAARQMSGYGGMLSFRVKAGREAAIAAVGKTRLFTRATSLGGVESLIEHRASSEGPGSRTPQDLIRVSVGLEHPDDLIEDLTRALAI